MSPTVSVPCNGCTACCQNDMLMLHPELGDDPAQYETTPAINPVTGKPGLMLKHKPNGGCFYLGESGCTIHDRAPAICRKFDCRAMFVNLGAAAAKRAVEAGFASQEVMDAGRKRRRSLAA